MNVTLKKGRTDLGEALRLAAAGACTLTLLVTLGCWGETPPPAGVSVSGKVVQGEVNGATVFADRLDSGARYVRDAGEDGTTTDAHGNFQLNPSYGNYLVVSTGGIDTITGQDAIMLLAPAGARNISPLTTLVALNPAMQAKIAALGVSYDADMSAAVTPAALLLAKSVETAVKSFSDAISRAGTLNPGQSSALQLQLLSSLATELAKPALTTEALTSPASLQDAFRRAVTSAVTAAVANSGNLAIANVAGFAANVSGTVAQVATALNPGATSFSTSEASTASEASQLNGAAVTAINDAVSGAATGSAPFATVTTDSTAPTVRSTTPADGSSGVQLSSFTAVFSEAVNPATLTAANVTLSYSGGAVVGTVTYDPLTRTVTFAPSAKLQINTPYTATIGTGVTDSAGNHLAAPVIWHYTTVLSGSVGPVPF